MLLELEVDNQRNLRSTLEELDLVGTSRRGDTDRPTTPPNSFLTPYLTISK
jgi:hypothetical protein